MKRKTSNIKDNNGVYSETSARDAHRYTITTLIMGISPEMDKGEDVLSAVWR